MKFFEHEGKDLFREFSIPVPKGTVVTSKKDLAEIELPAVVKAQVLSGKRGKRGLVAVLQTPKELSAYVSKVWGNEFDGELAETFLVEQVVDILQEMFVSITYSTTSRSPVLLFSAYGGVEVESGETVQEIPLKIGMDIPKISENRFTGERSYRKRKRAFGSQDLGSYRRFVAIVSRKRFIFSRDKSFGSYFGSSSVCFRFKDCF